MATAADNSAAAVLPPELELAHQAHAAELLAAPGGPSTLQDAREAWAAAG